MPSVAEPTEAADPTTAFEVAFWDKYNAHFEFPSSVVLSVLAFVTAFAVIVGVLLAALAGVPDRKPVPISVVVGVDDAGAGSAGGGGDLTPVTMKNDAARPELTDLPSTADLPKVTDRPPSSAVPDLDAPGQLPDTGRSALEKLEQALRDGPAGGRAGKPGPGKGPDADGNGPGGDGADTTRKRSLRWSLRFRSSDGRDYVAQLAAMKAVIVMPLDDKDALVFRDLSNPKGTRMAEGEWTKLAGQIQFLDTKADSVKGVAEVLGVAGAPKRFYAFFPQELEQELARLETGYRNRRAEDIEETVFRVTVRGGQYALVVEEQRAKQ